MEGDRPATRSPYASPPAYQLNGMLTGGHPGTGGAERSESERANGHDAKPKGWGRPGKHGWLPVIWADLARMQDQTCAQVPR